jgi:hypothetical protein
MGNNNYGAKVQGVGVSSVGASYTREYILWSSMLARCYSEKFQKLGGTYKGCTVDERFLSLDGFTVWVNQQIGFSDGYELDKDVLVKGNTLYSPDHCVFLPSRLNCLLLRSQGIRGKLPIGVTWHDGTGKFRARCSIGDRKRKCLGLYSSAEDAFNAYRIFKEDFIKSQAEKWKRRIDPRAYEALMKYEVQITD